LGFVIVDDRRRCDPGAKSKVDEYLGGEVRGVLPIESLLIGLRVSSSIGSFGIVEYVEEFAFDNASSQGSRFV